MRTILANETLRPGYAETSTRRRPVEPETVVIDNAIIANSRCVGAACIDGRVDWLAFRDRRTGRYYFQLRPW